MRFVLLLAVALCVASFEMHNAILYGEITFTSSMFYLQNCTFYNVSLYCVDCTELIVLNSTFVGSANATTTISSCSREPVHTNVTLRDVLFVDSAVKDVPKQRLVSPRACNLASLVSATDATVFLDNEAGPLVANGITFTGDAPAVSIHLTEHKLTL